VCHDLQGHALAAAFAQLDHGFDGAKAAVGFDIRMIADSHRPTSKANLEGALGTRDDIFARRCGGKPAIRRRGTFQRSCRIFDQAPRARLVEVLMRIHQPRYDKPVCEINCSLRALVRDRAVHRDDTAIPADCDVERLRRPGARPQHPTPLQEKCYAGQYRSQTLARAGEARAGQLLYTSDAQEYNAFSAVTCGRARPMPMQVPEFF
jgi:hypothetical protein